MGLSGLVGATAGPAAARDPNPGDTPSRHNARTLASPVDPGSERSHSVERAPFSDAGDRTSSSHPTALDRYVHAPDPAYEYHPVRVLDGDGFKVHVLEMTSQTWRSPSEVDRTEWKHWVSIYVPDTVKHRIALLYVSGGRNDDSPPKKAHPILSHIATATGSVTIYLQQVPNEPLTFAGEGTPRREDALIAYAWDRYLRTKDATWVPRLPMTKSVVRAMDTAVDFCSRPEVGGLPIDGFVVAGSSKRGWTTWTTAAVDSRVVAIVPMVIDLLNVEASFRNHYRSYGSWSPAIQEFVDLDIPRWLGTRRFRDLERIEDPYAYRRRLSLPKLIVNGTGDPFFLPDSSRFYFDDLPGEKYLRYVPNTDHSLDDTDAFDTLLAFYRAILEGSPRPDFSWRFKGESSIGLRIDPVRPPSEVRLWHAENPRARDFRLSTIGKTWTSRALEPAAQGEYVATVPYPDKGWTAFFVELTYPGSGAEPLKVTTAVRIIPPQLPYSWRGGRKSMLSEERH